MDAAETKDDKMSIYKVWDSSGHALEIEADSLQEACEEYCANGCWSEEFRRSTQVMDDMCGYLVDDDDADADHDGDSCTVTLDPVIPDCTSARQMSHHDDDDGSHKWKQIDMYGAGAGVSASDVCTFCGCGKTTKTNVQYGGSDLYDIVSYTPDEHDVEEYRSTRNLVVVEEEVDRLTCASKTTDCRISDDDAEEVEWVYGDDDIVEWLTEQSYLDLEIDDDTDRVVKEVQELLEGRLGADDPIPSDLIPVPEAVALSGRTKQAVYGWIAEGLVRSWEANGGGKGSKRVSKAEIIAAGEGKFRETYVEVTPK